jgi:outer membrane protein TolC
MCLAVAILGVACTSMDTIDRRVQRELTRSSTGMRAMPPTTTERPDRGNLNEAYRKTPDTNNPSASELSFAEAEQRDSAAVLARLDDLYAPGPDATPVDLEGTFRLGQSSSREYRRAVEDYMLAAIRLLIERHRWTPRLFNDTTANTTFDSENGRYRAALDLVNELRATQRLPFGGTVEAAYIASMTQQLVNRVGEGYTQASQLVLSANIPLLRDAGMIAQEDLIQAERNVVYAARAFERFRRELLVDLGRDYFDLVAQQAGIANQEARLRSVQQLLRQREALVEAGRAAAFDARNVEQNVLRSEATLINSRETFKFAVDRFKVRLGLAVDSEIRVKPVSLTIPEPSISVDQAAVMALSYRLDYQNDRDRVEDTRRAVEVSRNQLLPDLDVDARATFNSDDDVDETSRPDYDLDDTDYAIGVTFGLPLDREIERLNLRTAMINLQRAIRDLDRRRDELVVDSRAAVREVERARFALNLQEQAVEINQLRLDELEIKADEIDAQQRLDAENELLQSRNDRDQAQRDLRVAILDYLLVTGQMRVQDDGTFQPLEGMVVRVEDGADPVPDASVTPESTNAR